MVDSKILIFLVLLNMKVYLKRIPSQLKYSSKSGKNMMLTETALVDGGIQPWCSDAS